MRNLLSIKKSTEQEKNAIQDLLDDYNASIVPFTQSPKFIDMNFVVRNEKDEIVGGMIGVLYCWGMLYINILWVAEAYRRQGLGSQLMDHAIKEAKKHGVTLIHLDTFDFQAKDFYLKLGFDIFGVLDDCPAGHQRYYLKKKII